MINYDYADGPAPGSSTSVSPDPTHEGFWGRLKSFNFKNNTTYKNSYTYDGTGRLDQIKADHSTSTVFDYTYHVKANVVDYLQHGSYSQDVVYRSDSYLQDKLIHKWGTDLTKDQEARYTYDTLGRRSYEKTSGVVVEDLRPTKDRWGALTSYNDRNELTGYRLYEMTASWSVSSTTAIAGTRQSYTLDHMGNRTGGHQNDVSGTYTSSNPHDGLNQYSTARNLTVDYDNAGNMTDYGTKDYAYDAEDRLVKVTVGTTHYKYKYDYLGRRIGKYTGSTLNKKFVYQGWNLIAELSSTGTVQRTFTWGLDVSTTLHGAGGVGGLLMIDDELTSKRYYPIYDGSRNIVGLYDQAGALVASYEYDAFGRIILQSSGDYSDDNPFRFSTKYTDDETGLVYYGHRYYEPELGRFINRDPIEEDGGLNLYGFVGNDPVNFYDYLGMDLGPPPNDDHVNEEADPDILDDELRDEAEGRARAIAMERAGGLLSWIVQGAPVTYLDRLEGLYEAAFDRVENEFARYFDEIEGIQSDEPNFLLSDEMIWNHSRHQMEIQLPSGMNQKDALALARADFAGLTSFDLGNNLASVEINRIRNIAYFNLKGFGGWLSDLLNDDEVGVQLTKFGDILAGITLGRHQLQGIRTWSASTSSEGGITLTTEAYEISRGIGNSFGTSRLSPFFGNQEQVWNIYLQNIDNTYFGGNGRLLPYFSESYPNQIGSNRSGNLELATNPFARFFGDP